MGGAKRYEKEGSFADFLVSLLLTACEKGEYKEVVFQDEVITDRQIQIYKQRNRADIIAKYQKMESKLMKVLGERN